LIITTLAFFSLSTIIWDLWRTVLLYGLSSYLLILNLPDTNFFLSLVDIRTILDAFFWSLTWPYAPCRCI
jgi:hypothetical protein